MVASAVGALGGLAVAGATFIMSAFAGATAELEDTGPDPRSSTRGDGDTQYNPSFGQAGRICAA